MGTIVKSPAAPGTPEWRRMITASKVPAILGISRYTSQYAIWHEMAGLVEPEEKPRDRMTWGHVAEKSLSDWWLYKNPGWRLNPRRNGTYEITYTDESLPFANVATIDRRAYRPDAPRGQKFRILECKTAANLRDWGRPGEDDSVPMDYYAQVQFQMGVSGIHTASVVVLGPSPEPEIHDIKFDPDEFARIVDELVAWQASLEMLLPPALDDEPTTYETVRGLHPDIHVDETIQVSRQDAARFLDAANAVDEAEATERAAKIEVMELMGTAKYLKCGDVKVADRRARKGGNPYVQFEKRADLGEVA
ncbi:YqaJ viral recombinase family protein [Corynebacterium sp. p3-SID1194]|uniref:YqaJ viral recombinase family protein n=1 Tax=Corynebacterium sp. p3-SID1194 TaxID=2916105 RepID=UPI0021A73577|nr:YqaJ viral recombinase family protein [Corynebacterium sp. p3-SID1194]MCT1450622.1 YqaJ viral recombinase family protein [Corynebacterium sp. p3-SID1194]